MVRVPRRALVVRWRGRKRPAGAALANPLFLPWSVMELESRFAALLLCLAATPTLALQLDDRLSVAAARAPGAVTLTAPASPVESPRPPEMREAPAPGAAPSGGDNQAVTLAADAVADDAAAPGDDADDLALPVVVWQAQDWPGDPAAPEAVSDLASGLTMAEPALDGPANAESPVRGTIQRYLRASLGRPYRLGSAGPVGFDCSGLVLRAYEAAGLTVPRVSTEQMRAGNPVPMSAVRAGDLLFYRMPRRGSPGLHVVVYVGEGRGIHASVTHGEVREVDITQPLWTRRLVSARRML